MAELPVPLLRSPPFAGVRPHIAAVSGPMEASLAEATSPSLTRDPLSAFRAARVGGTFWALPCAISDPSAILRPRSRDDARRITARLSEEERRRALWLLPASRWARRTAAALRRAQALVAIGDVDPWPLLETGAPLYAHGDDEWVAFAYSVGSPVRTLSSGRFRHADETETATRCRIAEVLLKTSYRDPFSGDRATFEETLALLAEWRRIIEANRPIGILSGIAFWKRDEIAKFLWAPRETRLRAVQNPRRAVRAAAASGSGIAIWPSRVSPKLLPLAAKNRVPLIRIEDGFVRSVGLGSNLFPPYSITVDPLGIHYDPGTESQLERMLRTTDFPAPLLARAAALRDFIVRSRISKYGSASAHDLPARSETRRLALVPGQVEDDLSVLAGGGGVRGNIDLLRRARAREPGAEIWFRPHPDVDAGHRKGAIEDDAALAYADRVVRGGDMAELLDRVDVVHTLTSLTGFEALLRGREVVTHGVPFYAGWGLTRDLSDVPARRTRRLSLDELVATVLILYPRYLDPITRLPCPAEVLMTRFSIQRRPEATWLTRLRNTQGLLVRKRT